jgi:hypothetical protein
MKKLLVAFFFILCCAGASAQLQQQSMGGSVNTLNTVEGGLLGKLYFVLPKKDTLNNLAKFYPGALTIRPQDTLLTDYPPIYMSNGRFWISISSGEGQGIDSITVSEDSTLYKAYNQGNQVFTFSTLLRHTQAGANVYFTMNADTLVVNSVTGGTTNGLVSVGGLVLADSVLYIQHDIVWRISNVLYTRITDTFYVIPSADSNYYRKDVIYIDSADGSFNYLQGTQDTVVAYAPVIPAGGIIVTIVDVFGATITQPVPFIVSGYWATTGNLDTDASINYVGTSDSVDLNLSTKGLTRIKLKANGDIILPEYITGHTGTPIGNLQLDATGEMILGNTGSSTLQQAYDADPLASPLINFRGNDVTFDSLQNTVWNWAGGDFRTVDFTGATYYSFATVPYYPDYNEYHDVGTLSIDGNISQLVATNDSSQGIIRTGSAGTDEKPILLSTSTTRSGVGEQHNIEITPSYIKVNRLIGADTTHAKLIIKNADTLLTPPTYVYVPDADTVKVYPFPTGGGGGTPVYNETVTGSTSSTITLSQTYITGTIRLYKNGVRITDFTEATGTTITLTLPRLVGDIFIIDFNY